LRRDDRDRLEDSLPGRAEAGHPREHCVADRVGDRLGVAASASTTKKGFPAVLS
jgi:hypothetical protein